MGEDVLWGDLLCGDVLWGDLLCGDVLRGDLCGDLSGDLLCGDLSGDLILWGDEARDVTGEEVEAQDVTKLFTFILVKREGKASLNMSPSLTRHNRSVPFMFSSETQG